MSNHRHTHQKQTAKQHHLKYDAIASLPEVLQQRRCSGAIVELTIWCMMNNVWQFAILRYVFKAYI